MADHETPWNVIQPSASTFAVQDVRGERVCTVRISPRTPIGYRKAKSRADLIVRAANSIDELLAAIEDLTKWLQDTTDDTGITESVRKARDASRKAIGA